MNNQKKILIVEDDKSVSDALKIKLKEEGFAVDRVENGIECLKYLEVQYPDLILLDVVMPGLDGIEILKRVKEKKDTKEIVVVILTNSDSDEKVAEAVLHNAQGYLLKTDQTLESIVEYVKSKLD